MTKPGFDLILGSNILKELGIVLDFLTEKEYLMKSDYKWKR